MAIRDCGEADLWSMDAGAVVDMAREARCEALVYELPNLGAGAGHMPPATLLGFGKPVGVWEWLWRTSRVKEDRSVILAIPAMTWRSTVIGGGQRDSAAWKVDARSHCMRTYPERDFGRQAELPDALCLAEHAICSLDLADAVGVRRLARLGWTEPRGCWIGGRFKAAEETER